MPIKSLHYFLFSGYITNSEVSKMAIFNKICVCSGYRCRRGAVDLSVGNKMDRTQLSLEGVCPPVLIIAIRARDARGSRQTPTCQFANLTAQEKELYQ